MKECKGADGSMVYVPEPSDMKSRMPACPQCDGSGVVKKATLLMSEGAIANLHKLAEILPNEPVPVAHSSKICDMCYGTGWRLQSEKLEWRGRK